MTTTISDGTTTLTPEVVDGYLSARRSGNIVHEIIGSSDPAVTLRPATLRANQLRLIVGTSRALALDFETLLSSGKVLTLNDTSVDVAMTFVVTEDIEVELDDETRSVWTVTCGFQEVAT